MEGVRYMRGHEKIVVHPDCPGTAREFRLYSHATDRLTGDIKPEIIDANNHAIDAIRYAIAPLIKGRMESKTRAVKGAY
jgi:phage terminase large subunit